MPATRTSTYYPCQICGKVFTRGHDLNRHIRGIHDRSELYGCTVCTRKTAQKSNMVRHIASQHFLFDEPIVLKRGTRSTASSSRSSSAIDPWETTPLPSLDSSLLDASNSTPVVLSHVGVPVVADSTPYTAAPAANHACATPNPPTVDPFAMFMPYLTGETDSPPSLFDTLDIFSDTASSSGGLRTPDSLADFIFFPN